MKLKEIKLRAKILIGNSFFGFKHITKKYAKRQFVIINENTDIIIEGYPRSGNTFAVAAFEFAQKKPMKIARHRHEAGHVIMAVKLKKPVLIICRNPIDAVVSLNIREGINIKYALQYYIDFYKKVFIYKKNIVFVDFKAVTTDMGEVIENINMKFNTEFSKFIHTQKNIDQVEKVVSEMDKLEMELYGKKNENINIRTTKIAFPTKERNLIKNNIKKAILSDVCYSKLLIEAEEVYRKCLIN